MMIARLLPVAARSLLLPLVLLSLLCSSPVGAYDYSVPILVDNEDDIYELLMSEDISDDEKDTLIDLLRDPLDLNKASRSELYNLPGLTYEMVDGIIARRQYDPFKRITQLKEIADLTPDIYAQVKKFVRVVAERKKSEPKKKARKEGPVEVRVRAKVVDRIKGEGEGTTSAADDKWPEAYAMVQAGDRSFWKVGALVNVENTIGPASSIGSNLDAFPNVVDDEGLPKDSFAHDKYYFLETSGTTWLPAWPKVYASFNVGDYKALAGSYRVGFGQRLVFDTLGRDNPYGFVEDLSVSEGEYSFSPYKGLFGAVATIPVVRIGEMRVEATPFFSWWRHDSYQYVMRHKAPGFCQNSSNPQGGPVDDPFCYESYAILTPYADGAPGDYLQLIAQTLPRAYSELIGGANVTHHFSSRSHVGITGYVSKIDFFLGDDSTLFFGNTEYPERDLFYAFGADGAVGFDSVTLLAEAALMDTMAAAGILRALWELGPFKVEGSARYYMDDYDNPHSRGYAMSDLFQGSRRSGERGGMLSLRYRPFKWLSLRLDNDVWQPPVWADGDLKDEIVRPWRLESFLRLDTMPLDKLRLGGYVQLTDRDLDEFGRDEAYYAPTSQPPRGEKYQWGVQLSTTLIPQTSIWLYYKQSFMGAGLDKEGIERSFEMEHYATAKLSMRPLGFFDKRFDRFLVLDVRGKYFEGNMEFDDAFSTDSELQLADRYLEGYAQLGTTLFKRYSLALRGALREHLEKVKEDGVSSKKATEYYYKAMVDVTF